MHTSAPVCAVDTPNHLHRNKPLAIRQPTQHPLEPIHTDPLISQATFLPPCAAQQPFKKVHSPVAVECDFVRNSILTQQDGIMETRPRMRSYTTTTSTTATTSGGLSSQMSYDESHFQDYSEDEYFVPWQEEMRRVEAARFRRQLYELKRTRQQEQRRAEKPREWVWVVDEEMEVQEVPVEEVVKVSFGHKVKDVWRKVFNGKRRLSADELPLQKDNAMFRKLTVNFFNRSHTYLTGSFLCPYINSV